MPLESASAVLGAASPAPAPGAAVGAGVAPPGAPGAAANDGSWYAGFPEEVRTYASGKKWASPEEAVRSTMNLEKLARGPADKLIRLPEKPDDVQAMSEIYAKLGRPEKPDGYKLPVPEGIDQTFANNAAAKFHELGLSSSQGERLASWWNEQFTVGSKAELDARTAKQDREMAELRTEWGDGLARKTETARRFMTLAKIAPEELTAIETALGSKRLMTLLADAGDKAHVLEDSFVTGDGKGGFGMTPEHASEEKARLRRDREFLKRYAAGDVEAHTQMHKIDAAIQGVSLIDFEAGLPKRQDARR